MKQLVYSSSFLAFLFVACSNKQEIAVPENPAVIGLAATFQLPVDTATMWLQDYVSDLSLLDSVGRVDGLVLKLSTDKERLSIKIDKKKPAPISELKLWVKGFSYSIVLKSSVKQEVKFVFDPKGIDYKQVQLAGDINNWQPVKTPLSLINGKWSSTLVLNPGNYKYQLVVDGKWMLDPANFDSTSNGNGGFNSVLTVSSGTGKIPVLYTVSPGKNTVTIGAENGVKELIVLWDNYRLPASSVKTEGEKTIITLPEAASKRERSALRVWGYNEHGIGNDLLIPLIKNEAVTDPNQLKRDDFHAAVFYFMMVDRFKDGDTSNNKPLVDPRVDFKANYQGGDLAGVTQKIKDGYFKKLGINTIWVSPIVQNPTSAYQEFPQPRRWFSGYHGYWPVYETQVDTRFGNDAVLTELVETAHKNDINVVMDFVANHIHNENPVFKQHPEWFSSMYLPDGKVNIRIWDEQRLTTWFDDFMPDIDYTKPAAINYFSDSAMYWLKKFNIDGFRHDATKHVSETFWRALTRKVKQEVLKGRDRNVYQIGETFGSNELIASYIGSGMMDAQFNFNQYFDARPVFSSSSESFEKVASALDEANLYFGSHSLMGNITGNHDMPRFIYYAGGSEKPGEDPKEAGWTRNIQVEDPKGYERLKMLTAFTMTVPGIPIIYYGDEIGMPGAGDPDNRRMMRFSGLTPAEESVRSTAEKLVNLRRSSLALSYGDTRILKADKDQFVYLRQYFDKTDLIVMNRSDSPSSISVELPAYVVTDKLKAHFGNKISVNGQKITAQLKPLSFEIVEN
jgi:cyclomaltodextrinase